jgi:hypothetical protein
VREIPGKGGRRSFAWRAARGAGLALALLVAASIPRSAPSAQGANAASPPAPEQSGPDARPPAAPPAGATPSDGPPTSWHATAFVSGIGTYRIIHYWSQGASMRAETLISGHPVTTLVHGDRYVVIDRLLGRALEIVRSPKAIAEDAGRPRPFAFEQAEIRAAGGEKVEDTKIAGVDVEVWRVTDDLGRRTVWVAKGAQGVPLRVETFVRGSSQTVKIDYSAWGFNLEIPTAFFALPPGLEVVRMTYDEYARKSAAGPVGPAPILYPDLLHGERPQ